MIRSKKRMLSLFIALVASLIIAVPTYAIDNSQSLDGSMDLQNDSIIIEGIENAIEEAANSPSGYAQDDKTGIIGSADGHAVG